MAKKLSSPCIGVCKLDAARAACTGCGRTLAEIAAWPGLDEAARRAIMARLKRPVAVGHS